MPVKKRMYAEIAKVEEQDDGTIKVYGYASSGAVDSDGETVTPEAMKAALPDYMKFGAVREMHQAQAAGTAIEATVEADGKTWFGALVVDPVAVKKVQTGVYKGFSIGGKVTQRDPLNKRIIKGLNLMEVSLVDRPANPEAVMTMFKAEGTPEDDVAELAELLDEGTVTPAQVLELIRKSQQGGTGSGVEPDASIEDDAAKVGGTGSLDNTPLKGGGVAPEPVAALEPAPTEQVQKGMYTLSRFAELLGCLSHIAQDTAFEAQYEGDNSPIPAALASWLKTGLGLMNDMAAEEGAELLANLQALTDSKEGTADKVAKAGARFSKITKAALSKIHAACKEAGEHLDSLKYMEDDAEDAEGEAEKVAKAEGSKDTIGIEPPNMDEAINKAVSTAIAPLNEALEKARKDASDLQAKVDELSKRAAPGKALLRAVSLTKSQDAAPERNPEVVENVPAEGTPERADYEMRKVFKSGGKRLA